MAPVTEDILGCHIFVIKRTCKIKVLYNAKFLVVFICEKHKYILSIIIKNRVKFINVNTLMTHYVLLI